MVGYFLFLILNKLEIYGCRAGVKMDLRDQIRRDFLSTAPKGFSTMFCKLMIISRIVTCATWSLYYFCIVFYLFRSSYDSFLFWKLAIVSIVSNRALRIAIFKAFGLRKVIRYFGRRIVHTVFLYFLMRGYRELIHLSI